MSETIVKTQLLSLDYLPANQCVRIEWLNYPNSQEFRDGMDAMLAALLKHNTMKLLVADGKMGAVSDEDQKWVAEEWTPKSLKAGAIKTAIVLSSDIFNQLSTESMVEQSNSNNATTSNTSYFPSEKEALEWLA